MAADAPIKVALREDLSYAELAPLWQALEPRAQPSFFLSGTGLGAGCERPDWLRLCWRHGETALSWGWVC